MKTSHLQELLEKNLLTTEQFQKLEEISSKKIFSVFYELRTLLYLGVLLFTTGVGILIYQNIGELGHLLSIIALFVLTVLCFVYAFRNTARYSHERIKAPSPYFDYVVLLGSLLFVSGLGYIQFQYNLFDESLGEVTLVSAMFFFYAAYRFDHLGVLSLGITALASFWGISLSPQQWYHADFFEKSDLHVVGIFFGAGLAVLAVVLDKRKIKQHFTFTYLNFASLTFLTGALAGMFINNDSYAPYFLALLVGCALAVYGANWKKSFLFLLYAFVFGYIGITFFLSDTVIKDAELWFLYLLASCGGFIFFIIRYRNYFKRAE
jgi:Predicted membrane protein (DUF2157)